VGGWLSEALGGVLYREWPGELPGRGIRCLAAERGESGQQEYDKRRRRCCDRGSARVGHGLWRGFRLGGSRLARGEVAETLHARCSMLCRLTEHGRGKLNGRNKIDGVAGKAQEWLGGCHWRGVSGRGDGLCHKACRWRFWGTRERQGWS
jgi:hypothetical protein